MDQQLVYVTALLAIVWGLLISLAADWLWAKFKARRLRLAAAKLHDCKPGCFMSNKNEDLS